MWCSLRSLAALLAADQFQEVPLAVRMPVERRRAGAQRLGETEVSRARSRGGSRVPRFEFVDADRFGGRGGAFKIHETLVKFYPVEYHAQAAVNCVFALTDEHGIEADDVERIENETYEAGVNIIADGEEKWRPRTRETADHSMPYCVARAFLDGEMTLAQFDEAKYTDPEVIDLMDRVEVEETEAYTERYGESFPHRMVVHTGDGTYEQEVEYPKGRYENPLSGDELREKFTTGADGVLSEERREAVLAAVQRLGSQDVSALTDVF